MEGVKVRDRDDEGGDTEQAEEEEFPGPEPVMNRASHPATGGHT